VFLKKALTPFTTNEHFRIPIVYKYVKRHEKWGRHMFDIIFPQNPDMKMSQKMIGSEAWSI